MVESLIRPTKKCAFSNLHFSQVRRSPKTTLRGVIIFSLPISAKYYLLYNFKDKLMKAETVKFNLPGSQISASA